MGEAAKRIVSIVLGAATVVAIALMMRGQDWSVLTTTLTTKKFAVMAAAAIAANATAILLAMVSWQAILGGEVEGTDAARIYFVGQFAKYVPGKVFSLIVSIRMGKAAGVTTARMASAWLLTIVVALLTGATVALAAGPELLHGGQTAWLALAALPIAAVLIKPDLVNKAAAAAAKIRKQERPPHISGARQAIVAQLMSWIAGGVHLWILAVAMGAPAARSFALCVGVFCLAAVVGMFAVFTTDGLGVREVILLSALSAVVPAAGVVALVSRLVVVVSELATAAVGLAVTEIVRRRRRQGLAKVWPTRMNPATEDR